jgi:hypothetical protein
LTLNSFHKAKHWTKLIMWKYWSGYVKLSVHRKKPKIWLNNLFLHHDSAPAHKVLSIEQFLAQKSITVMEHPPCSNDLVLSDFWLFPKMKSA